MSMWASTWLSVTTLSTTTSPVIGINDTVSLIRFAWVALRPRDSRSAFLPVLLGLLVNVGKFSEIQFL